MFHRIIWGLTVLVFLCSCQSQEQSQKEMTLTSSVFTDGGKIPEIHTCDGKDISPPLTWTPGPEGTKSYALICDDADASNGTWVHWILFNISPELTTLPRRIPPIETVASGFKQGVNDFGNLGYSGPCPPRGTHRYYYKLYALDTMLELEAGITKEQLDKAMRGHILAKGELMGRHSSK